MSRSNETDSVSIADSTSLVSVGKEAVQIESSVALIPESKEKDLTTNFFVVGAVINIVMVAAYFFWAYKQWKK